MTEQLMYEAATASATDDEARDHAREQARLGLYAPPTGWKRRTGPKTPPAPRKTPQGRVSGRTRPLRTPPPGFTPGISLAQAKALVGATAAEDARLGTR